MDWAAVIVAVVIVVFTYWRFALWVGTMFSHAASLAESDPGETDNRRRGGGKQTTEKGSFGH